MKSQPKKVKTSQKYQYNSGILQLLPILFVIAVIPLIVLTKKFPTHLEQYTWYSNESTTIDCFLYYKQFFLLITGAIMLCLLLLFCYTRRQDIRYHHIFLVLGIYAVLALLSTLISEHRINGLAGIPDQMESVFILMVYCLLCFYSYQFVRSEKNIRWLMNGLLVSVSLMILLGISQMSGHDFISSDVGRSIINSIIGVNYGLELNFGKTVFLSMFNPNYVGVYCVLILPILLILLAYAKDWKHRILYIVLSVGLVACLIGSGSQTGMITLALSILFLLLLNRQLLYRYKKVTIPVFLLLIAFGIVASFKLDVPQRLKGMFFSETISGLDSIETSDNCVSITYQNEVLNITFETDQVSIFNFTFTDAQGSPVEYVINEDNSSMTINDTRYPQFLVQPAIFNEIYCFRIMIDNNDWFFTNLSEDGSYYYMNCYGKLLKLPDSSQSALPESFDSFASNRGFIWSKSIPLLKDHILLGTGADCFVFAFPNEDYVSMANHGFLKQLMTKPHSLYLQIGVQTGVLSLIAFLIFYAYYFITSLRLYFKMHLDTYMKQIGVALLVSTAGYMFSGIMNDSTVTVTPIYWVFLGMGLAINLMIRSQTQSRKVSK